MTEYLWMALYGFGLMFLPTFLVSFLTRRFLIKFPDSKPVSFISGFVLTAVYLMIVLFAPVSGLLYLDIVRIFLTLCLILLIILRLDGIKKEFCLFVVSMISVFMIPSDMPLFQQLIPCFVYPLLGLSLYLIIRVFMIMDRVQSLSLITIFMHGLLYFFVARSGFFQLDISSTIFYIMLVSLTVIQASKALENSDELGQYAASVTGFVWGFLGIYVMAKGSVFAPFILLSYDFFEILLAVVMTLITTHRFYPIAVPFLVEQAVATGKETQKINRYLFLMSVGLVFAAYVVIKEKTLISPASILVLFILMAMYMRLKNWGKPKVSFKDLKSDLKQGLSDLKAQLTHIPLKTDLPKKKVPQKGKKGSKK